MASATVQMKVRPEDLSQVPKGGERIPESGHPGDLWRLRRPDQAQAAACALSSRAGRPAAEEVCHCRRGAPAAGRRVCGRHARGHCRVRRRRRGRSQARGVCEEDQLLCAQLRRCFALRGLEGRNSTASRKEKNIGARPPVLSRHRAGVLCAALSRTSARRAWRSRNTGASAS